MNQYIAPVLKGAGAFLLIKTLTVVAEMTVIYINQSQNNLRRNENETGHQKHSGFV